MNEMIDSSRLIKREILEQEARARFDRFHKADPGGAPKGLRASDARSIVDRDSLFLASLRAETVAHLEPP